MNEIHRLRIYITKRKDYHEFSILEQTDPNIDFIASNGFRLSSVSCVQPYIHQLYVLGSEDFKKQHRTIILEHYINRELINEWINKLKVAVWEYNRLIDYKTLEIKVVK